MQAWIRNRQTDWQRLEALMAKAGESSARLTPAEIREVGLLYRAVATDLARSRSQPGYTHLGKPGPCDSLCPLSHAF
jgi:hypothetical protein